MKNTEYTSATGYYKDQLILIDAYINAYLDVFSEKLHTSGQNHLQKSYSTKDQVREQLTYTMFETESGLNEQSKFTISLNRIQGNIDEKIKKTMVTQDELSSHAFLPFEYLSQVFNLNPFEKFVIMLSFAVELDRKYEKIFSYLNDFASKRYPTIQTACLIFDQNTDNYMKNMTYFHSDSKLMKYFFKSEDSNVSSKQLKLHDSVTNFMLDSNLETILLPEYLQLYLPDEDPGALKVHLDTNNKIENYLSNLTTVKGRRVIMNIYGPEGIGKMKQVKQFCHSYEHAAVIMSFRKLQLFYNEGFKHFTQALKQLAQTVLLHQAVLILTDVNVEDHRDLIKQFYQEFLCDLAPFVKVSFILSDLELPSLTRPEQALTVLRVPMAYPDGKARKELFESAFLEFNIQNTTDLNSVSSKFVFTPDQITNAVHDAVELSKWNGLDYVDSHTMHVACRSQLNHNLDKRAQRIDGGGLWEKLILPDASKDRLIEVCNHVKYKNLVLDDWGFKKHLSYGTGLAVLFAGPPGTGKTFSARILAKELDLELYKVDLSQMISKYIGETEKNISALFDDASGSSAILLFDEGDALFGKRTEMKDSHDRYANVETAFLLQKIEAYEGISILTTNFMQNIDPAFLRRFRFVVHYPIPDIESRLKIWNGIYPDPVPISKHVDFSFLAKNFELTGGHIKNIALTSAFKAASNSGKVDMKCILLSIQYEMGKTGKTVLRSDFGEYAYMLDE